MLLRMIGWAIFNAFLWTFSFVVGYGIMSWFNYLQTDIISFVG